jgi:hypothetical protein
MFSDTWFSWRLHMRIILILLSIGWIFLFIQTYKRGYKDGIKAATEKTAPK